MQLGGPTSARNEYLHKISMFNAQLEHLNASNNLFDNTTNVIRPFSLLAEENTNDALYYHQEMQAEDKERFKEAMSKEVQAFKDKEVFEFRKIKEIPSESKIVPMIWSFKRKRSPTGEITKHKARLCVHGGKQTKRSDYWNTELYYHVPERFRFRSVLDRYG